jgi:hypothetical protein
MPGLMALRDEFGAAKPLEGAHRRLPPYDHPDRCADRDTARARRDRSLELVQHLLDPGPCSGRYQPARSRCSPGR